MIAIRKAAPRTKPAQGFGKQRKQPPLHGAMGAQPRSPYLAKPIKMGLRSQAADQMLGGDEV